jgi:hypothetical protein
MNLSRSLLSLTTATAVLGVLSAPVQAALISFGTGGIQFDQDTTVRFNFLGANNQLTSTLFIYRQDDLNNPVATLFDETKKSDTELQPDLWVTTCGGPNSAVSPGNPNGCSIRFTFQANVLYTLGLRNVIEPGDTSPIRFVYSTIALNSGAEQAAIFGALGSLETGGPFLNPDTLTSGNPFPSSVLISFEDGGFFGEQNDFDYNDFRISARVVPTPPVLGGLMLVGGLSYFRKRRQEAAKQK